MLAQGEFRDVLFCLLKGRKGLAVRLLRRLAQIFVRAFLLYHNARFGDVRVDKVRNGLVFNLFFDLLFKKDKIRAIFHPENARKQINPKRLRLAFFIPAPLPASGKLSGAHFLFRLCHSPKV